MTSTLATLMERLYPSVFNANFVSLVGQIPLIIATVFFLMENGLGMKADDSIDNEKLYLYCGIALFWFTTHDLMDGQRARRL
jgi:phosphatidylglycerophosphate synthase